LQRKANAVASIKNSKAARAMQLKSLLIYSPYAIVDVRTRDWT
jgi:hypothetical protein